MKRYSDASNGYERNGDAANKRFRGKNAGYSQQPMTQMPYQQYYQQPYNPQQAYAAMGNGSMAAYTYDPYAMQNMQNMQLMQPMHSMAYGMQPYGAPAQAPSGAAVQAPVTRSIYLGNVHPETTLSELTTLIRSGPLESIKIVPEKQCTFVNFVDAASAGAFYTQAMYTQLTVHGQLLRVGWGKLNPLPREISLAVQRGATRTVFIGNVDAAMTEETIYSEFEPFGPIDSVQILGEPGKQFAFVHLSSISSATKAIEALMTSPTFAQQRLNYGKDKCALSQRSTKPSAAAPNMMMTGPHSHPSASSSASFAFDPYTGTPLNAVPSLGSRVLYLGNLHPDTTYEDLCNGLRGGQIENMKILPEKHCAFIHYIDAGTASHILHDFNAGRRLIVRGRELKVGSASNNPLPMDISLALQSGASRNVYIGKIAEFITEDRLRKDFGEFGAIEQIYVMPEKKIAFVNYTSIASAMKAMAWTRGQPDYGAMNVSFGKDRCATPYRSPTQGIAPRRQRYSSEDVSASANASSAVSTPAPVDDMKDDSAMTQPSMESLSEQGEAD